MARAHLTDEDIQNGLDGNLLQRDPQTAQHLETCKTCHSRLQQYRQLYHELKKEPNFALSDCFVKSVLSKLPTEKVSPHPSTEIVLFILGALFALGTTVYFVDMKPVVEILGRITLPKTGIRTTLLIPIKNLLSHLNGNLPLLFFAGLVLLTVGILDRILSKWRQLKFPL